MKPASKTVWRQGEASAYAFFGENRMAYTITVAEVETFKQSLINQKLALYTVRKRLQSVRMFFNAMAKQGFITSNPFDGVKGV